MDNYVIRIYSREKSNPHALLGTVEGPGIPIRKSFVNLGQLWDILNSKKKKQSKTKIKIKLFDKGGSHGRVRSQ